MQIAPLPQDGALPSGSTMDYRQKVAALYLLGFFIDLINMFITSAAYPGIGRALGASVSQLGWISTAYIIGLTIVIPVSAPLAAYYGSKRIFISSLLMFLLASMAAGQAGSIDALIAWRALQGLGGGLLIPLGQSMAYRLYRPAERPGLSSVIMLVGLLAPALSPALGGLIVDQLSWRAIFYLNLPLAALALLLAACWLQADSPRSAPREATPLLNLRLLAEPLLRTSMLMYLLVPGVFMGVSLLATLYLQELLGMTASNAGGLMLPWAIASFGAIALTGKSYRRVGPKPLLIAGALLQAAGVLMLIWVTSEGQLPRLALAYALMGFGGGLCSSTAQATAFLRTPDAQLSQASAVWNINRQLGFCLGVTLASALLELLLAAHHVTATDRAAMPVFHLCFALAAALVVLPLALCLRIDNRAVLHHLETTK